MYPALGERSARVFEQLAVDERARASRLRDVQVRLRVRTRSSRPSAPTISPATGSRWRASNLAYSFAPLFAIRPSIAERTVVLPDQFSAVRISSMAPDVHVRHRDETALAQRAAAPGGVFESDAPGENAAAQIELLPVGEDPHAAHIEPLAVGDAKLKASQFGRLTRSSFSTVRPPMSVRRRL